MPKQVTLIVLRCRWCRSLFSGVEVASDGVAGSCPTGCPPQVDLVEGSRVHYLLDDLVAVATEVKVEAQA